MVGRHVLDPAVFGVLEHTGPGRGVELRLTGALREPAEAGTVRGAVSEGPRYGAGDKADHLRSVVRLACARPDLGPEFRSWLRKLVAELEAGADYGTARTGGRERRRAA
ncbi:hypothetical protein ACIRUL_32840 [Streptomyces sp. NPDC101171]|uniref:hypothetical protein n=1 Tax=Streptomyces sp. NPDC101171 TaxID=3366122 RepID=UPI00380A489C